MQCPECKSTHINKNGHKKGKQNHICLNCGRQFIDSYETQRGYSEETKNECLKMYVNGMGFRGIERAKKVHHTTIINWVKQVGELLPDYYEPKEIPEVGELDELETFIGSKKTKLGSGQQ
jgi:transposase-like protein